ncbi:FecR domain-containing protein [Delftia sp. RIT313]|uniref:FecR domain-containing protein n=1 Tax=Delftia sp. RIT313 TaxID=1468410 RepID=UPI00044EE9EA|nr:FecR domain-containing protein [Delftia sp. RIT313]EZP54922.1 Anti-FecI sigma factor, FecR [Delftia sp. RIT313]
MSSDLSPGLIDEAIQWSVRLDFNTPSPPTRQAFEQWLHAQPAHALAWDRVQSLRTDFDRMPQRLALDTLDAAQRLRQSRSVSRRRALKLLSLSGIATATGWMAYSHTPWQRLLASASTSVGEQRTVRLDDGSTIVLNTDTAIRTELDPQQRLVVLSRGEILVTTGADETAPGHRPFRVRTPFGDLQALGTRFVVRLHKHRALVSVQEGAVLLTPAKAADSAARQTAMPGSPWWLSADASTPAPPPDFGADDWADGVMAGRAIRLGDLLAELGRYRHGHISCDERVAGLRLSGTFHVRQTEQVLQLIAQTQPVSISRRTRWWVHVGPASGQ